MKSPTSSSAMLLSVVVMMLGAVMLKLSGGSQFALLLSVLVLSMGLGAMMALLCRSVGTPGQEDLAGSVPPPAVKPAPSNTVATPPKATIESRADAAMLAELLESFEAWWARIGEMQPWPAFDRWVRDTLRELGGARRSRCHHVQSPQQRLFSLTDDLDDPIALTQSWRPLVEQAIETGRMFVRPHNGPGGSIPQRAAPDANLAEGQPESPQWVLPIRMDACTRGLIVVTEFSAPGWRAPALLRAVGGILALCWARVQQEVDLRFALQTDRATGVLNRADLAERAERVLAEAAQEGEPVVLIALAIEGLRRLDDGHQWELQNWLMQQVGQALHRRLRSDDLVGRFSDDRFVVLMRRVDLALGELIARKVLGQVRRLLGQAGEALASVQVRCGLAGDSRVNFEQLLGRACNALHEARAEQRDLACAARVDGPGVVAAATLAHTCCDSAAAAAAELGAAP